MTPEQIKAALGQRWHTSIQLDDDSQRHRAVTHAGIDLFFCDRNSIFVDLYRVGDTYEDIPYLDVEKADLDALVQALMALGLTVCIFDRKGEDGALPEGAVTGLSKPADEESA